MKENWVFLQNTLANKITSNLKSSGLVFLSEHAVKKSYAMFINIELNIILVYLMEKECQFMSKKAMSFKVSFINEN